MKLRQVTFGDDEVPESVTVEMTTDEMAVMYAMVGHISPKSMTDATGDARWANALFDVADCISGAFFNRYWEDGTHEVAPRLTVTLTGRPEVPDA